MANVLIEEQTMKDIGNAIRLKSGTEKKLKPYEMPKAIGDIPSVDTTGQYFRVPKYAASIGGMFRSVRQVKDFTLDLSEAKNLNSANNFIMQTTLTTLRIVGSFPTDKNIQMRDVFRENYSLTAITGTPLNASKWTLAGETFQYIPKLEYIRFVQETIAFSIKFTQSSVLSDVSIQSIIDGLADLTGKTAQIIYLHTSVVKRLTDKQLQQISSKNWSIG